MATSVLDEAQWQSFLEQGYLVIGPLLDPATVNSLQEMIDSIMLGEADCPYDKMLMQLDSETGRYEDAGEQTNGHKGSTLNYRKIQGLEFSPPFLELMRHPVFEDACRRIHGHEADIACYRAMFMNKPANRGTFLPWHQDRWTHLDRDPELTVWVALDPATKLNGCVQVIPGTHQAGLINPSHHSGFLTDAQAAEWAVPEKVVFLELSAGDVAILHNRLLHSSDRNHSNQSRRAFSVCYMDAATRDLEDPTQEYPIIFGQNPLTL
jgi:ectoine hydroxylase-related dioxygenase (phytanoyl-CoA dioxygenase family)